MTPTSDTPRAQRQRSRSSAGSRARASFKRMVEARAADSRVQASHVRLKLTTVPPSVNNMFPTGKNGGRFLSSAYEAWRKAATAELRSKQQAPLVRGPITVSLRLERPNAASDLDNRIKASLDLLKHANVIEDDKLVQRIVAEWAPIEGVEIEVRAV